MTYNDIDKIKNLVDECVKLKRLDFLSNIIYILQQNYQEVAKLATNGAYNEGWSHPQVIDYITYET